MASNVSTVIASLVKGIKLRDMLGIQNTDTVFVLQLLDKYIEYCKQQPEVVYRQYDSILRDKLTTLLHTCSEIIPKKLSYVESAKENEIIEINNVPLGSIVLSYKDLLPTVSHSYLINEITIESTEVTFNGRDSITVKPFEMIICEPKYFYFRINSEKLFQVYKTTHKSLTALGFFPYDLIEDVLIYKNDSGNEFRIRGYVISNSDFYSAIRVRVTYVGNNEELILSHYKILFLNHTIANDEFEVNNTTVTETIDVPEVTESHAPEQIEIDPNGVAFNPANLYDITFISKFLVYDGNVKKVKLSSEYTYEEFDGKVIAVPILVSTLISEGWNVSHADDRVVTLEYPLENGNTRQMTISVFNITNSLFLKYRVQEGDKIASKEIPVVFTVRLQSTSEDKATNETKFI